MNRASKSPGPPIYQSYNYPIPTSSMLYTSHNHQNNSLRFDPSNDRQTDHLFKTLNPHNQLNNSQKESEKPALKYVRSDSNLRMYQIIEKDSKVEGAPTQITVEQSYFRQFAHRRKHKSRISPKKIQNNKGSNENQPAINIVTQNKSLKAEIQMLLKLNKNLQNRLIYFESSTNPPVHHHKNDILSPCQLNQIIRQEQSSSDKQIDSQKEISTHSNFGYNPKSLNTSSNDQLFTPEEFNRLYMGGNQTNMSYISQSRELQWQEKRQKQEEMCELLKKAIQQIRLRDEKIELLEKQLTIKMFQEEKNTEHEKLSLEAYQRTINRLQSLSQQYQKTEKFLIHKLSMLEQEVNKAKGIVESLIAQNMQNNHRINFKQQEISQKLMKTNETWTNPMNQEKNSQLQGVEPEKSRCIIVHETPRFNVLEKHKRKSRRNH